MSDERYKGMDTLISVLPRLLHEWTDLQLVLMAKATISHGWSRSRSSAARASA